MKRTSARTVLAVVVLLVVGSLPAAAGASDSLTLGEVRNAVAASMTNAAGDDVKHLGKAVGELDKALDPKLWDGDSPSAKGKKVFDHAARAAAELARVGGTGDLLDALLAACRDIASAASADVSGAASGREADKAIKELGKAWKEAAKASGKTDPDPIPATTGDGIFYTFTLVRASTINTTPEILTVSGSSAGNEGLLYSDEFHPVDTYLNQEGVIQVHVSCSDAFTGGIGVKSDPAATSEWRVVSADITKYKGGVVAKQCTVSGVTVDLSGSGWGGMA